MYFNKKEEAGYLRPSWDSSGSITLLDYFAQLIFSSMPFLFFFFLSITLRAACNFTRYERGIDFIIVHVSGEY